MIKGISNMALVLLLTFILFSQGLASEGKEARDTKESLIRIEERMVTKDELKIELKEIRKEINTVRAELKGDINFVRIELKDFLLWGFGITFAGIFALIGFVLWDRRTALAPAIRKNRELEEREERIERALKEFALKDENFREALKRIGLL